MKTYCRYSRLIFGMAVISMLTFSQSFAQEDATLSWNEAIERALKTNLNFASEQSGLQADKANVAIARGSYLPHLNMRGSVSDSKAATFSESSGVLAKQSGILGASLSQMIYNESYLANHKIQKYLYASQEEQLRNTRYQLIMDAGVAYISILMANDLYDVQVQNLELTQRNLQAANDRYELGATNQQEVLRWQTQLFANEQQVVAQRANVLVSQASFNQLLYLPIETMDILQKLSLENDGFIFSRSAISEGFSDESKSVKIRDFLVNLGLENSPVLASMDKQIEAQDRQLKSNKRYAIPNFSLSAGADAKFPINVPDIAPESDLGFWKVGASMSWPLVSGGSSISKVHQSRSELSSMQYQRENMKTIIDQNIRSIVNVTISDFQNIDHSRQQAEVAEQNYMLVLDSYLVGESSLLDLLDAQQQRLNANISARMAYYTFFGDLIQVEQAIGYFPFLKPAEEVGATIQALEALL